MRRLIGYVTISSMMNHFCFAAFFSILFFISGCAWLGLSKNVVGNENALEETASAASANPFVKTGKVVDAGRLEKSGKVLVVPFLAGANVAADERSDKIALMIVSGIADELKGSHFQILNETNAHEAELIIAGHVTGTGKPSQWSRWLLQASRNIVTVEGSMVDAASKSTVLVFTHSARSSAREKDHARLGYDIGKDIGRYIRSAEN